MSPDQRPATNAGGPHGAEVDHTYIWGRAPDTYLAPRQLVRLMILRSRLDDRHLLRNRVPAQEGAA
jgi:hypothetical protein